MEAATNAECTCVAASCCNHKQAKNDLVRVKEIITDVKEKIDLVKDTCCFASVDLDYDEFELMIRSLEEVIEKMG